MLPLMLCAGVGNELPVRGDVVGLGGRSDVSKGIWEGLCGEGG